MSFAISSNDVRLEQRDGHIFLCANARREDGSTNQTSLNLDDCLGNINGQFSWGGGGFTKSSESVTLSIEGPERLPILRAKLKDDQRNGQDRNVNLSERIKNVNGSLVFQ